MTEMSEVVDKDLKHDEHVQRFKGKHEHNVREWMMQKTNKQKKNTRILEMETNTIFNEKFTG